MASASIDKIELPNIIKSGSEFFIKIFFHSNNDSILKNCRIGVVIKDFTGRKLILCSTEMKHTNSINLGKSGQATCLIDRLPLPSGDYLIDLFFETDKQVADWIQDAYVLSIKDGNFYSGARQLPVGHENTGIVLVDHSWTF